MEDNKGLIRETRIYVYLAAWAALVGLTFLTVWIGTADLKGVAGLVPFVIAAVKAMLVLAFFMHLWYGGYEGYEGRLLRLLPALAVVIMVAVMVLVISDVAYRG